MKKATLYQNLEGNRVKCTACNQFCIITDGKTGICNVRKNIDGELHLLIYGKPVSTHIDPIEKKPLYHFLPGTRIYSIGTFGCNFRCDFCQNWDISQTVKGMENLEELLDSYSKQLSPEKVVSYCSENDIPSIAYTYNEPAVFFEYAYDTAVLASKSGIKNVFVSNGYESEESIKRIAPYLDAINVDLKSFSNDFYIKRCGAKLQPVLDNIKTYFDKNVWIEITTLVIPGENDSDEELRRIAQFIVSVSKNIPWHISRFHPAYKMDTISPTPLSTLNRAYEFGKDVGLKYVYIGNILNSEYVNTHCFNCGNMLIEREYNEVRIRGVAQNEVCEDCGMEIDLVLE